MPTTHGYEGLDCYVLTVQSPWRYTEKGSAFIVDHITVENTADGGATRWIRDTLYNSDVWAGLTAFIYIDGTNGNDENQGFYASAQMAPAAIKTHGEFIRRLGYTWHVYENSTIQYVTTYPSDPLPLVIDMHQRQTGTGPIVNVNGPALTQFSAGSFSAVTDRDRALNTPYNVTDGVVVTTGDVQRRIRIVGGPRANARAWVAKSTGAGQRRTSEWVSVPGTGFPILMTQVTPQIGDQYVIEGAASSLILDHIVIEVGGVGPIGNASQVFFNEIDFMPVQANGVPMIQNGGSQLFMVNCGFTQGEWQVWTDVRPGDNDAGLTAFVNCMTGGPATGGVANFHVYQGQYNTNLFGAGLVFGNLGVLNGAGLFIDFDTLCQGNFCQPTVVSTGQLVVGTVGVMDFVNWGVTVIDALLAVNVGGSGAKWIWGTTAAAGAFGMNIEDGGRFRYLDGTTITITGPGGDFQLGGSGVARAWDDVAGAYTANIACTWPNLMGGALKDNAHNLMHDAHAYKNSGQAQP